MLIRDSYSARGANRANPIEVGIVELLGANDEVLSQEYVYGVSRNIDDMLIITMRLLSPYVSDRNAVVTIRQRHTHPIDLGHGPMKGYAFSDNDMRTDSTTRQWLNLYGVINTRLESWIVFMRNDDFITMSDISRENIRTRGYLEQ
jgi:hypothetical protein